MSKLRKDNYVRLTTPAGAVYGKVTGLRGESVNVVIDGRPAVISRPLVSKVPFAEYKANADRSLRNATPTQKFTRGDKKTIAIDTFCNMVTPEGIPTRKEFLEAATSKGLTAKGASTYYYKLKSGRWG